VELGQGEVPVRNADLFSNVHIVGFNAVSLSSQGRWLGVGFLLMLMIAGAALGLFLLTCTGASSLTRSVRMGVHSFSSESMGVGMAVESISVNQCTGLMEINGLELMNPPGYQSPSLLRCDGIHLEVDLLDYVWSTNKRMCIRRITVANVDVTYEKKSAAASESSSNVQDVIDYIEQRQATQKSKVKALDVELGKDSPRPEGRQIQVRDVFLEDVGGRVAASMFHGRGLRHNFGQLHFSDFDLEMGDASVEEIGAELAKRVLKVAVKQLAARNINDKFL